MIELKNLSLWQGATATDLRLQSNRIYGVLGAEGAGKSALLACLAGASLPYGGCVKINGFDTAKKGLFARGCVGYLPKKAALCDDLTVSEEILFVAQARRLPYERTLRQLRDGLELTGLETVENRLIKQLTPLEKAKLAILLTTVGRTDTLVLDSPLEGLDEAEEAEVTALIRHLASERTVFIGDTRPQVLLPLCDRLLLLANGTVEAELSPCEFSFSEYEALCEKNGQESENPDAKGSSKRSREPRPEKDGEYELIEEEKEGYR